MRSWLWYVLLLIVVGGLIALQWLFASRPFAEARIESESLTSLQEKQIELFRESNSLLSTLATAAIGAVGALLFNRYKDDKVPFWQQVRAMATVLFSAVSIYCGYLAHDAVLWMLQNHFLNIATPRMYWSSTIQAWTFLAALIALADFFLRGIQTRPRSAGTKGMATIAVVGTGLLMLCGFSGGSHAQVRHERTVYENLAIRDEVHAVVQRWAEATGVEVEPDAQAKITAGFADEQTRLKMAYDKQGLASAEQQSDLRDALVVEYLYDVRDMKLAKLSKPAAPALNVNRLSDPAPEEITKLIISAPDVISFSPAKFLASFRLIFDNKVGYLDVLSDPDEARITIDDEKKEEFTCRSFVISPGDHTVAVVKPATRVNCAEKVRVNELETATVVCPKGKTKCSLPKKK